MIEKFVCILYGNTTNMTLMNEMGEAAFPKCNSPSYYQRKMLCLNGNELAIGLSLCRLCYLLYRWNAMHYGNMDATARHFVQITVTLKDMEASLCSRLLLRRQMQNCLLYKTLLGIFAI